jgi:hypothetical protein
MDILGERISEIDNILVPDLLDSSKRAKLLSKLLEGKKIEEPKISFQMSISQECQ